MYIGKILKGKIWHFLTNEINGIELLRNSLAGISCFFVSIHIGKEKLANHLLFTIFAKIF